MAKWVEKRWDETYQVKTDDLGKPVIIITKLVGTRQARLIRTMETKQA